MGNTVTLRISFEKLLEPKYVLIEGLGKWDYSYSDHTRTRHTHQTQCPNEVLRPLRQHSNWKTKEREMLWVTAGYITFWLLKRRQMSSILSREERFPTRTCEMKAGEANGELRNRRREQHELTLGEETPEHVWAPPQLNTLTHDKAMASTASARFYFPNCKGFLYKESCKITKSLSVLKTRSPIKQK